MAHGKTRRVRNTKNGHERKRHTKSPLQDTNKTENENKNKAKNQQKKEEKKAIALQHERLFFPQANKQHLKEKSEVVREKRRAHAMLSAQPRPATTEK